MPTLRRIVSRTDEGAKVTGRTGFLLDYIDVDVRRKDDRAAQAA